MEAKMYDKFVVIKKEDVMKYLNEQEQVLIGDILTKISKCREENGRKPMNHYYVVNIDEPYAEVVKRIIIDGENDKI